MRPKRVKVQRLLKPASTFSLRYVTSVISKPPTTKMSDNLLTRARQHLAPTTTPASYAMMPEMSMMTPGIEVIDVTKWRSKSPINTYISIEQRVSENSFCLILNFIRHLRISDSNSLLHLRGFASTTPVFTLSYRIKLIYSSLTLKIQPLRLAKSGFIMEPNPGRVMHNQLASSVRIRREAIE